ncbi:MAG TPA: cation:proton antiporter [Bryobacteraceae bacterium]|jgi:Kef-type K+ transport system membrane component KefB|nr:cation:proton antiporter [Bryobacteraceae bacterium]
MPELKLLFLQMAFVLAAAKLLGAACRLMRQPEVVGEIAAGILLGPSLLGSIAPRVMDEIFPASGMGPLYALSQIGLVLFMFVVGLEVRPGVLRKSAGSVVLASQASIVAPFVCGVAVALAIHSRLGNGVPQLPFALFLGGAMEITAFPVLARILMDRGLMNTRVGQIALWCAAVDDVSAWCLLAVITVIARPEAGGNPLPLRFLGLGVYVLVMLFAVRPVLRRVLPAQERPGPSRFSAVMVLLLASVWTTEALSVHALFGAFLAGVVIPSGGLLEAGLRERLESVTVALLLPLFFAYNGLRTSIALLNSAELWALCGLIIVVAIGSKLLLSAVAIRASGIGWRESLAVGVLVNTRGLVELVILKVGLDLHILSPTLFSMMVIMALATTVMTSPLLDWIYPKRLRPPA